MLASDTVAEGSCSTRASCRPDCACSSDPTACDHAPVPNVRARPHVIKFPFETTGRFSRVSGERVREGNGMVSLLLPPPPPSCRGRPAVSSSNCTRDGWGLCVSATCRRTLEGDARWRVRCKALWVDPRQESRPTRRGPRTTEPGAPPSTPQEVLCQFAGSREPGLLPTSDF